MLPQGWLFPGRNSLEPLSTRQLNRAVHEAAEAAGIKRRVSPRTLRQSTTALHAHVTTKTIRSVTGPLERLKLLMEGDGIGAIVVTRPTLEIADIFWQQVRGSAGRRPWLQARHRASMSTLWTVSLVTEVGSISAR